jgi:hypothetical protein
VFFLQYQREQQHTNIALMRGLHDGGGGGQLHGDVVIAEFVSQFVAGGTAETIAHVQQNHGQTHDDQDGARMTWYIQGFVFEVLGF